MFAVGEYQTSKSAALKERMAEFFSITVEGILFPYRIAKLSAEDPDSELVNPIADVSIRSVVDSWGAPRPGERVHEGVDIFSPRGTPVYSATRGYVVYVGTNPLGGKVVFVLGAGGVRYYYAHLDEFAAGLTFGNEVSTSTLLGFVGNTGNATQTPPHLHFGMYRDGAHNPYNLLIERPSQP